jgi:hypothetical protein
MADVLKKNRIKQQYDGYVSGWSLVVDEDAHLWIRKASLENMISGYDGFLTNIHVYGRVGNLTADISNSAESFDMCGFDKADFVLIDRIVDMNGGC